MFFYHQFPHSTASLLVSATVYRLPSTISRSSCPYFSLFRYLSFLSYYYPYFFGYYPFLWCYFFSSNHHLFCSPSLTYSSTSAIKSPPSSAATTAALGIANISIGDSEDSGLHYVKITGNLTCMAISGLSTRVDVSVNNRRISVDGDLSRLALAAGPYQSRKIMETGVSRLGVACHQAEDEDKGVARSDTFGVSYKQVSGTTLWSKLTSTITRGCLVLWPF